MSKDFSNFPLEAIKAIQTLSLFVLLALAITLIISSVLAAFGVWPWMSLDIRFGETVVPNIGMYIQLGVTGLFLGLCSFLPTQSRILKLETSHRRFDMDMNDVARAYQLSHASDREGSFTLSKEFDAVRERLLHLRDHPDLRQLEPEILEVAAQMSFQSRDLARIYSDEKLSRARGFLQQRQTEAQDMADRLSLAQTTCDELKRWLQDVEADERVAKQQIERLEADLLELLPNIGYDLEADINVVKLSPKKADSSA